MHFYKCASTSFIQCKNNLLVCTNGREYIYIYVLIILLDLVMLQCMQAIKCNIGMYSFLLLKRVV